MRLWGITASVAQRIPRQSPRRKSKTGATVQQSLKIPQHLRFLGANYTQRAHKALKAHTSTPPPRPGKQPLVAFVRGAWRERQAGYSPPVCCIINW
jgi:hypothetical protein